MELRRSRRREMSVRAAAGVGDSDGGAMGYGRD